MTDLKLAELIARNGRLAWQAVLIGNPPPMTRATYERMRNPVIGDLVLELSYRRAFDPDSLGWLRSIGPSSVGEIWAVEPLVITGADLVRWSNCDFIALPHEAKFIPDSGPPFPGKEGS